MCLQSDSSSELAGVDTASSSSSSSDSCLEKKRKKEELSVYNSSCQNMKECFSLKETVSLCLHQQFSLI